MVGQNHVRSEFGHCLLQRMTVLFEVGLAFSVAELQHGFYPAEAFIIIQDIDGQQIPDVRLDNAAIAGIITFPGKFSAGFFLAEGSTEIKFVSMRILAEDEQFMTGFDQGPGQVGDINVRTGTPEQISVPDQNEQFRFPY